MTPAIAIRFGEVLMEMRGQDADAAAARQLLEEALRIAARELWPKLGEVGGEPLFAGDIELPDAESARILAKKDAKGLARAICRHIESRMRSSSDGR